MIIQKNNLIYNTRNLYKIIKSDKKLHENAPTGVKLHLGAN